MFSTVDATWDTAVTECLQTGGVLVAIETIEEHTAIKNELGKVHIIQSYQ